MWLARIAMVIVLFVSQRADAETQAYWAGSMAKRTVVATVVIAKQPMMFVYERDAKSNVTSSKGWTLDGKEVASVEALPDAVQKRVAASRTPRLSARTRSAALRYLDELCADTWCEGDYSYRFTNVACNEQSASCTMTMKRTPYKDKKKLVELQCTVFAEAPASESRAPQRKDLMDEGRASAQLVDRLSQCIAFFER
jgi:hypothetical protein